MKYAACIEYDGTAYFGWQRLSHGPSVQGEVEKSLSKVANHDVELTCAGRTDSGVHGIGQVVHFESDAIRDQKAWQMGCNTNLPDDIAVTWAQPVADEFHARFSAVSRSYRYVFLNCLVRSALNRHRAWWVYQPLDAERMHTAAQALVGKHDFSAFRAAACQASTATREILCVSVARDGDKIYLDITANAFLQHMVRNIAGTLAAIGVGNESIASMSEVLESRDRKRGGVAAPPHGLTLVKVRYPSDFPLPKKVNMPS